jgi:hypothetical protein
MDNFERSSPEHRRDIDESEAEEQIEALRAKVEELTQERDEANERSFRASEAHVVTMQLLQESQAREQQLRDLWIRVEAEYFSRLKEQDETAANFEAEKDMYGWNFHKGLRGGLVEFHIYMTKIARALTTTSDNTALDRACKEYAAGVLEGIYDRSMSAEATKDYLNRKAEQLRKEAGE